MKRLGSLLLALLAGFAMAALLDQREAPSSDVAKGPAPRLSPVTGALPAAGDAFAEAWRVLAEDNLTSAQRHDARKTLLKQWASADPQHLLRFFEGRALPHEWDDCLGVIAREHPEMVIQYARDHGSRKAMDLLVEKMDPRKALETLAADAAMPPELFATVGRRGSAVEPAFASRLADLPDGPAREQFAIGVIETDLAMSRWKEACVLASMLDEEKERAAGMLGEHLATLPGWEKRSDLLLGLTDDLRGPALATLVERLAMREDASDPQELKAFVEELVGENGDEGLARALERMAPSARVEVERVLAEPAEDASAE
jgi:hypothetical protein